MSAVRVAQACYDKYKPIAVLPATFQNDVDSLAGYFHGRGELQTVFFSLVPWNDLVGEPNSGHAAIADFLICGAAAAALSANFDPMIEQWQIRGGSLFAVRWMAMKQSVLPIHQPRCSNFTDVLRAIARRRFGHKDS
jgi:hypothetical protein